jgi:hypothetical protein
MITVQKYTIYSIIADSRLFINILTIGKDFLFHAIAEVYFNISAIYNTLHNPNFLLQKIQVLDLFIRATFQTMYIIN